MHDDLEMEGSGDEDEGVEGGDDTKDIEVLPHGRDRGLLPEIGNSIIGGMLHTLG